MAACLVTGSFVSCRYFLYNLRSSRTKTSYAGAVLAELHESSAAVLFLMTAPSSYTATSAIGHHLHAVLSLGRIEYLHPEFHDVKNFWPVGYKVGRLAATPASGKKECLHTCEILERPDGSGPLFRSATLLLLLLMLHALLYFCRYCCCSSSST